MSILSPYELARQVYEKEPCARDFYTDVDLHLRYGCVFVTSNIFLLGRPVQRNAPYEQITHPGTQFDRPDCWLIYLASGDFREFFKYEPYPLPWFCWERNNKLRFYLRERVLHYANYTRHLPNERSGEPTEANPAACADNSRG
jgi:hypothetical protein